MRSSSTTSIARYPEVFDGHGDQGKRMSHFAKQARGLASGRIRQKALVPALPSASIARLHPRLSARASSAIQISIPSPWRRYRHVQSSSWAFIAYKMLVAPTFLEASPRKAAFRDTQVQLLGLGLPQTREDEFRKLPIRLA